MTPAVIIALSNLNQGTPIMVDTLSDGHLMCDSEGSYRGRNVVLDVVVSEAAVSSHSIGATFARNSFLIPPLFLSFYGRIGVCVFVGTAVGERITLYAA
jgi:hypothetical protein